MNKIKKTLLWTSAVTLLPMVSGLVLWNRLPDQMISHWGPDGTPDDTASKWFVVFGLPLLMVALQWLCAWVTMRDPGNRQQNRKVLYLPLWIVPLISILCGGMMQAAGLGLRVPVGRLVFLLLGALFVVVGNYLPKCSPNRTIGIKIKWTLADDGNWYATHRLAGRSWCVGGVLLALCAFLPDGISRWVMIPAIAIMVVVPILYSWQYDRRRRR
ncbi:MAG: SdpI family protein [Clostridia bacterium]|nr:SdpI family protein [Clostridia bacterium]